MEYQDFLEYIKNNIAAALVRNLTNGTIEPAKEEFTRNEEDYDVCLQKISKNNGIILDAVTIYKKGQCISPNLYLNPYYEKYQLGMPLDRIMDHMVQDYMGKISDAHALKVDNVYDFNEIQDKIVVRLINYDRNRLELAHCPHKRYLDFAITFRYLATKDAMGVASSIITDKEFDAWNVGVDELYEIAIQNTMKHFPWQMDSLAKVIAGYFQQDLAKVLSSDLYQDMVESMNMDCGVNMFVLTNDVGINGATCILYHHVLERFASVQESNLFILPASVHEVILIPEDEEITDPEFLKGLVEEANLSSVGLIDLLSDHIYYYDRTTQEIIIYDEVHSGI